jgi:hypothetical protein
MRSSDSHMRRVPTPATPRLDPQARRGRPLLPLPLIRLYCLTGDDAKRSLLARAQRLAQENHITTRLGSSPYATPPRLRFPPLHPCAAGPRGLALAASPVPGARQCRCSLLSRRPGLKFTVSRRRRSRPRPCRQSCSRACGSNIRLTNEWNLLMQNSV